MRSWDGAVQVSPVEREGLMPAEKAPGRAQLESGAEFWAALSQKEGSRLEQVPRMAGGMIS